MRLKDGPDDLIGVIELKLIEDDNRGFWLRPDLWGQGLMTEACDAVTEFWFEKLNQKVLRVPKATDNIASRRISERSGMRVIWQGQREYVFGPKPAEIWEITRDEWRRRRSAIAPMPQSGRASIQEIQ